MEQYVKTDKEQWRDIEGYDELYQVSDRGRVRKMKDFQISVNTMLEDGLPILNDHADKDGYRKIELRIRREQAS